MYFRVVLSSLFCDNEVSEWGGLISLPLHNHCRICFCFHSYSYRHPLPNLFVFSLWNSNRIDKRFKNQCHVVKIYVNLSVLSKMYGFHKRRREKARERLKLRAIPPAPDLCIWVGKRNGQEGGNKSSVFSGGRSLRMTFRYLTEVKTKLLRTRRNLYYRCPPPPDSRWA